MTRAKAPLLLLLACAALSASGCSRVRETLGAGRNSPDEFLVVKRAPLTLPPDYNLRAPEDGQPRSDRADVRARGLVLGADSGPALKDRAEDAFLQKLGAASADPGIRAEINRENGLLAIENRAAAEKLIFWKEDAKPDEGDIPEPAVDAKAEAARLKKNREEGLNANEGEVPVVEKKKSAKKVKKLF